MSSAIDPDRAERLEIYKLLVEMADRVSQRRQAANSFYLSVNTLLVGGSAFLGTIREKPWNTLMISTAGLAIAVLWLWNIASYKTLNAAKFAVIQDVEKELPLQPFTNEWDKLDPTKAGVRHKPFHTVERLVPWVFVVVYGIQMMAAVCRIW